MLREGLCQRLDLGLLDLRHRDECDPPEGFQSEPAIGKSLPGFAGEIRLGPVGKLEPARDAPLAGAGRAVIDTLVAFVEMDRAGKFHCGVSRRVLRGMRRVVSLSRTSMPKRSSTPR